MQLTSPSLDALADASAWAAGRPRPMPSMASEPAWRKSLRVEPSQKRTDELASSRIMGDPSVLRVVRWIGEDERGGNERA